MGFKWERERKRVTVPTINICDHQLCKYLSMERPYKNKQINQFIMHFFLLFGRDHRYSPLETIPDSGFTLLN